MTQTIEQLDAERKAIREQIINTAGHGSRGRLMKQEADLLQEILKLAYRGMTKRQEYIALCIISHMKKTGRVPNFATIHTDYKEGQPVFELLRENGALRWTKKPSRTGRMMNTLELTF